MTKIVRENSVVKFRYTLKLEDGTIIDKDTVEENINDESIIEGIREALLGMKEGEKKEIVISPEKGFGYRDENLVLKVPKDIFPPDMTLEVGGIIDIVDEDGSIYSAIVKELGENYVILDFNHPLAGKKLVAELEVISIQ